MDVSRDSQATQGAQPGAAEGAAADALPLAGVRVLDAATFLAAPFCGTILGDFGAEVIKIEQPKVGDNLRRFGTPTECGDTLVWMSEARNKKSVTLDLRSADGAALFRELVRHADVVLENFRPGTFERWGIGFEDLRKINPKLVMLRISAYGQNGPKKGEPGFARIAHAFGGLSALAGEPGGLPVVPGSTSLADYISGMWGAIGVLLALRRSQATGKGQIVDVGLYESVFRLLDEIAPAFAKYGVIRERMGADTVNVVPHSHYQTADGKWIAIACTSDKMFARLAAIMGRPELGEDPRFASTRARLERRDEVNRLVADWVRGYGRSEVLEACRAGEVPCGPIYSIDEIFEDEQYRARGNLMEVDDPRLGPLVLPSALPTLSETPARFAHAGRALGADNEAIFSQLLSLDPSRLQALQKDGVI